MGTKKCNRCKQFKPLDDFNKSSRSEDGLQYKCKCCASQMDKEYRNRPEIRERHRNQRLQRMYGITSLEYDALVKVQDDKCKICLTDKKPLNAQTKKRDYWHIDHCHDTGRVRGLLCGECNKAVGLMKEDVNIIKNLLAYVEDVC